MKKALLTIFVLSSLAANAQDYVVTLRNDTLRGTAKISDYDIFDRVDLLDTQKKKNHFTAVQVKTVFMHNEVFHTVRSEDGYRFMKLVKPGFLSLYLGRRPSSASGASFQYDVQYLVKLDGGVLQVPNLAFKKVMSDFLVDCQSMKDKITSENLGKKDLDKIISDYNSCIENQTTATNSARSDSQDPTVVALTTLKTKLEASQLPSQKDAIDILNDITGKVMSKQPVPNYLLEGLKGLLKDAPDYQSDLEAILSLLKSK